MRTSRRVAVIATAIAAVFGGIAMSGSATAAPVVSKLSTHHVCASSIIGGIHCDAIVLTGSGVTASGIHPNATSPGGLNPADLRAAYGLTTSGTAVTVAIVDAFDDPSAEADLGHYRSQFGLPACTTANGCFRKVNQNGATSPLPSSNVGWAEEESLDIDMVSAICPNCHILLVEASSATIANLGTAVNRAATMGATAISNSYGGGDSRDTSAPYYNHPGIAVTASSGDSGFGAQFPATSHYVTAVGGTHLVRSSTTRGWTETVWNGAGSGCSSFNTALTGAASFGTGCSRRAEADVSAVADPATGVSVYDSFGTGSSGPWLVFGGTSVASPIIASVFALANNSGGSNNYTYGHYSTANFNDVTSGSNGSCSPTQLCHARVGWDGPTGLGTPHGLGGF